MSWGRTENPKKVYKIGDSVKCFIKEINGDKIALSVSIQTLILERTASAAAFLAATSISLAFN